MASCGVNQPLDSVRARDVAMSDKPDEQVLEFAADNAFLLVSHDVNTMPAQASARLAAGRNMAGLLMVQQTQPIGPVIEDLLLIWSASEAEEWQDQIRFLPL
jgi:hypothetical protein